MAGLIVRLRDTAEYGDRVCTRVFVGQDTDSLQLAGTLHLDVGEWQAVSVALMLGAEQMGPDHIVVEAPDSHRLVEQRAQVPS